MKDDEVVDDHEVFFLPRIVDHPAYRPSLAGWRYVIGAPLQPGEESSDDAVLWCLDGRGGWWLVRNNIRVRLLTPDEAWEADCAIGRVQPTREQWTVDTQAIFAELDLVPPDAPTTQEWEQQTKKRRPAQVLPWKRRNKG